jgi:hypothetical protein
MELQKINPGKTPEQRMLDQHVAELQDRRASADHADVHSFADAVMPALEDTSTRKPYLTEDCTQVSTKEQVVMTQAGLNRVDQAIVRHALGNYFEPKNMPSLPISDTYDPYANRQHIPAVQDSNPNIIRSNN